MTEEPRPIQLFQDLILNRLVFDLVNKFARLLISSLVMPHLVAKHFVLKLYTIQICEY